MTGSGAHVAMVGMVDNASRIGKTFIKYFINGIIVVQTNPTLHTLKPHSSHIENLRSEIFEAHRQTDRQTDGQTEIPCFNRVVPCCLTPAGEKHCPHSLFSLVM